VDAGLLREAQTIADRSEIIDLHLDTLIPVRIFGWDVNKRHGRGLTFGSFFGHVDLPRMKEGRLGGGMWSITTNPFRFAKGRWRVFQKNLTRMKDLIASTGGQMAMARTLSEYKEARARGAHAVMISVQGGNCFDAAPNSVADVPDQEIVRVTVLHLTNSWLGGTSAPNSRFRRKRGLTEKGRALVSALNRARVFVDLAHIHPDGFWDAVEMHDRTQPLLATHTGVCGVRPHWRNLDDRQLRAIADTGGTVGIIYSKNFLQSKGGATDGGMVVDHMEHVIKAVGEDYVSIGSDYDGAIIPPRGLDSSDSYVRLIGHMLERRWPEQWIEKALGQNFLRAFALLRP
jgi:membrane dipeptidase